MTADTVISAEAVGKKYHLGQSGGAERYLALRDAVARTAKGAVRTAGDALGGRWRRRRPTIREDFWALKDVSFELTRGEVLGIIGRNGAGKSTLLKILSRITEPTTGRVAIAGRVASLLEVGTGFHPELTGRENIYLNGAILGMPRAEIKRKFDEIVAFGDVATFLDTPVKRYSSGMYVRLAFAVAAHLEPEILIVDEVLAVGDAEFQRRCLGKMGEIAHSGRTVLFVSHNIGAVLGLCSKAMLLEGGQVKAVGTPHAVAAQYGDRDRRVISERVAPPDAPAHIRRCAIEILRPGPGEVVLSIVTELKVRQDISIALEFAVRDAVGNAVGWGSVGALGVRDRLNLKPGNYELRSIHDVSHLADGHYTMSLMLSRPDIEWLDRMENCLEFQLQEEPSVGAHKRMTQKWGFGSTEIRYVGHELRAHAEERSA